MFQETPFPTDQSGTPVGKGCLGCKELMIRLCPEQEIEAVAEQYHGDPDPDSSGPSFKMSFERAREIWAAVQEHKLELAFQPAAQVMRAQKLCYFSCFKGDATIVVR